MLLMMATIVTPWLPATATASTWGHLLRHKAMAGWHVSLEGPKLMLRIVPSELHAHGLQTMLLLRWIRQLLALGWVPLGREHRTLRIGGLGTIIHIRRRTLSRGIVRISSLMTHLWRAHLPIYLMRRWAHKLLLIVILFYWSMILLILLALFEFLKAY